MSEDELAAKGDVASRPWETAPFVAFDHGANAAPRAPRDIHATASTRERRHGLPHLFSSTHANVLSMALEYRHQPINVTRREPRASESSRCVVYIYSSVI